MRAALVFVSLIAGCAARSYLVPEVARPYLVPDAPSGITFKGDGTSAESRVIIQGTDKVPVGLAAERAWLRERYRGYRTGRQELIPCDPPGSDGAAGFCGGDSRFICHELSLNKPGRPEVRVLIDVTGVFGDDPDAVVAAFARPALLD